MANETTSTQLSELTQAAILQANMVVSRGARLTKYVQQKPVPKGKSGVSFPFWDSVTAASLTEGTDLTNTQFNTTSVTVSPGEVGLMGTLTDVAEHQTIEDAGVALGNLMGEAILDKVDQDIYALFDGFSTAVGTTNVDITEALIHEAVRNLRIAKAPGPYWLPLTPHVLEDAVGLYTSTTNHTADEIRNMAQKEGRLPMIGGAIPVMIDSLATGTSTGQINEADTKTACFSSQAIGYAVGWSIRIERQRDASMRGDEIVGTAYYGVGEIKDAYGVEMLVDNAD